MTITELREKAGTLPLSPGVYIMRDDKGEIIYVGKAVKLQNRVKQYFTRLSSHTPKTLKMVSKVADFDVINAPTELDALLLENTLIKKHKPKYNILLKDDKGYPFIKLSDRSYPTFSVAGKRDAEGRFFGPFGGRGTANAAVRTINDLLKLPTCGKKFPRDTGKGRPCLRYHLNKCCGLCTGKVTQTQYAAIIDEGVQILEGKSGALEKRLAAEMEDASARLEFEQAAALRDKIKTIQNMRRDNIVCAGGADADAIGFAVKGSRGCVAALSYKNGNLADKRIIFFDGADEQDAAQDVESFVNQYYNDIGAAPKELYLPCEIEGFEATGQMLSALRGRKCEVSVPKRGEKLKMVRLAEENAMQELDLAEKKEQHSQKTLTELAEMLGIEAPRRIEAYDISHTAGSDVVASMTVFDGWKPQKGAYKRFKVNMAVPGDDPAAMAEVVGRRLDRALSKDEGFLPLPELILADGGEAQVLAALSQIKKRGLSIPVFGMIKDDRHRTRGLAAPDGSITGLAATPAVFALIGRIQEETHRFAIEYHRKLHSKNSIKSSLSEIPGIGEARGKALLKRFGSIKGIKSASFEELCSVVPRPAAEEIIKHFERTGK